MKIIVSGATGFLGKRLVQVLAERGHTVIGLGRNKAVGEELEKIGAFFSAIDLSQTLELEKIIAGADQVIHCAAMSTPWGKYGDFYAANVEGTQSILKASSQGRIGRFIHVSTPSLYVEKSDKLNIGETDPLPEPINDYAKTKLMAEKEVDKYFKQGLEAITIRPQGIFGVGDPHILPRIMRVAARGSFPVLGDGQNWIDMTHVDNVVNAIELCMKAPKVALGKKYNITNDQPVQNYKLLEEIFLRTNTKVKWKKISFEFAYNLAGVLEFVHRYVLTNSEPVLTRYSVCALGKSRTLSLDAAKNDLNYSPVVPFTKAIDQYVEWWNRENSSH